MSGTSGAAAVPNAVAALCRSLQAVLAVPAAVLDAAGPASLLDAAAALEDAQTRLALAQARVLAALRVAPAVSWLPSPSGPPPRVPAAGETTAHELAFALRASVEVARERLATATALGELPAVTGAAAAGHLRWWQVRRVVDRVAGMTPATRATVDVRIARDAAAGRCTTRFAARLARAVVAADPAAADRSHAEALAARRVTVRPAEDGMSWFGASLSAQDALTVASCVDELSRTDSATHPAGVLTPPTPGCPPVPDGRTADQRRADAVVSLARATLDQVAAGGSVGPGSIRDAKGNADADGSGRGSGSRGAGRRGRARHRGEVQLVVSAETVLGISDAPGELRGHGPVGPVQARRIAGLAGMTWRRMITDPTTGTVLDRGRTTYTPPVGLADEVVARGGWQCTRPGCGHAATDVDHARGWAELGPTAADNLHGVCRGCHTAKHQGWTVRIDSGGTATWTTPHGRSASTPPTDHRPEDRTPPPWHRPDDTGPPPPRSVGVVRGDPDPAPF